ncbi:hypothetical protein Pmani_034714 [Petrolisthes manimaculis]|uniref:Uncharacterized protein n=1 Tax=Petrolisthes manimaculis TaxID=1843537 RepID=A0AAE1NPD5_9EUCA|nr:hypothetical protein Pmani_034714 [Petrolisthes manimaculis]
MSRASNSSGPSPAVAQEEDIEDTRLLQDVYEGLTEEPRPPPRPDVHETPSGGRRGNRKRNRNRSRKNKKNRTTEAPVVLLPPELPGDTLDLHVPETVPPPPPPPPTTPEVVHHEDVREVPREDVREVEVEVHLDNTVEENTEVMTEAAAVTTTDITEAQVPEPKSRIAYSRAWVNKSYLAKDDFNPRGMEHLYLITTSSSTSCTREKEVPRELGE